MKDSIRAEDRARRQHLREDLDGSVDGRRRQEGLRAQLVREQRLDFTAEGVVFRACLGEKICAFVGRKRRCLVIEPLDVQPAVRRHQVRSRMTTNPSCSLSREN